MDRSDPNSKGFADFFMAIPWPWHLVLGVAGYLILHFLATRQIPLPDNAPDEVALYAHRFIWKTAAAIFQYVVAAVFGLGVILSWRRAGKKRHSKPQD